MPTQMVDDLNTRHKAYGNVEQVTLTAPAYSEVDVPGFRCVLDAWGSSPDPCAKCDRASNSSCFAGPHKVFAPSTLRVGNLLAGKFRIEKLIGNGGMGLVFAAHHVHLDQRVAIKVLRPRALKHQEAIRCFLGEAQAAAKLDSQHIVRVLDANAFECGLTFLVMEYLEGNDLSQWVANKGTLPVAQAVDFVLQACEALALAHTAGIVHRDVKPSNLFCCERPDGSQCIKVIDFGISIILQPLAAEYCALDSHSNPVMGSPQYMSPEQLKSPATVDARADIWSLGVTLFELLTAHLPFDGKTLPELEATIAGQPTPAIGSYRVDVPPTLQEVVERCLRKDAQLRYAALPNSRMRYSRSPTSAFTLRSTASTPRPSASQRASGVISTQPGEASCGTSLPADHPAWRRHKQKRVEFDRRHERMRALWNRSPSLT